MPKLAKRIKANKEKYNRETRYGLDEAIDLLQSMQNAKFDEAVEVAIRLGVDPRKSDQMVRGVARLPHGTGRTVRVLVFAKGENEQAAKDAGADFVGAEDLVDKIKGGWLDFDKAIATPDMMAKVGPIAKILGPRGLMPNPKVGTVTRDVAEAVKQQKAGSIEFRVDKAGIVHAAIGKKSFEKSALQENLRVLSEQIHKLKPSTAKGTYIQSVTLTSTMGPGIKIEPQEIQG